jgi:hypothetical protein
MAFEIRNDQWRPVELSLFDLVQSGHRIIAVTSDHSGPDKDGTYTSDTFFLQKEREVYRCWQEYVTNSKEKWMIMNAGCKRLVQPYRNK